MKLELKNGTMIPVYFKLQSEIKENIEKGRWKPGMMIPPERVFVEKHGISIGTVKKAITNLVNEGFLYRIQGKGTFVTDTELRRNRLRYYRLLVDFKDKGSDIEFKVLETKKIPGQNAIKQLLKIRSDQKLIRIKRLMMIERQPLVYAITFLPEKLFMGLESLTVVDLESQPLYTYLEEHYDVPTISNRELISAVEADDEVSACFGIQKGLPLLKIEMLAFTHREKPYEYRISFCRTHDRKVLRTY
jgi:GntR family transcriptional regulator